MKPNSYTSLSIKILEHTGKCYCKNPIKKELITLGRYWEHFSDMSSSTGPPNVTDNQAYTVFDPILDRAITMEEEEKGVRYLKKGKSHSE